MAGLERMYVCENRLSGGIPALLESLEDLEHLYLQGSGFTRCIPAGLRDAANNDLDRTGLQCCSADGP